MPECFVAKASELKDGDRRIVVAGSDEIGVFFKDGAYLRVQQLLRPFRRPGLRGRHDQPGGRRDRG